MRLLGPVEVENAGLRLHLTAPRERDVLAALMLEANRVVSVDRLIDAIWGDSPPETARAQVQICASTIRRALAKIGLSGMVVTRKPGYQLHLNAGVLDTDLLDTLVKQANEATRQRQLALAERMLQRAIDLWQRPALADIDNPYADPFRAACVERRLMLHAGRLQVPGSCGWSGSGRLGCITGQARAS